MVQKIGTSPYKNVGLVAPGPQYLSSSCPFLLGGGLVNMSGVADNPEQHNDEISSAYNSDSVSKRGSIAC